jgi:hypothetical protein
MGIETFSVWIEGLIDEDKDLGVHPVNRGGKYEADLYSIYVSRCKMDKKRRVKND